VLRQCSVLLDRLGRHRRIGCIAEQSMRTKRHLSGKKNMISLGDGMNTGGGLTVRSDIDVPA
jgi:hypothetical protein